MPASRQRRTPTAMINHKQPMNHAAKELKTKKPPTSSDAIATPAENTSAPIRAIHPPNRTMTFTAQNSLRVALPEKLKYLFIMNLQ